MFPPRGIKKDIFTRLGWQRLEKHGEDLIVRGAVKSLAISSGSVKILWIILYLPAASSHVTYQQQTPPHGLIHLRKPKKTNGDSIIDWPKNVWAHLLLVPHPPTGNFWKLPSKLWREANKHSRITTGGGERRSRPVFETTCAPQH